MGQIKKGVQINSAVAKETAATGEELSAQAAAFYDLAGRFTLKDVTR